MKTITRNKCIICKSDLELSYSFSKFPMFMGTTDESRETDVCKDLNFSFQDKASSCIVERIDSSISPDSLKKLINKSLDIFKY